MGKDDMVALPKDHPAMIAFAKYKQTEDYANTRKWAANKDNVDGSMWAAFFQGYLAAMEYIAHLGNGEQP